MENSMENIHTDIRMSRIMRNPRVLGKTQVYGIFVTPTDMFLVIKSRVQLFVLWPLRISSCGADTFLGTHLLIRKSST